MATRLMPTALAKSPHIPGRATGYGIIEGLGHWRYRNQREGTHDEIQTDWRRRGPFVCVAGPAMARHVTAQPGPPTQSIYCATREAGPPPPSRYCDYQAWSVWRVRGSWNSTLDNACYRTPTQTMSSSMK